MRRWQGGGAGRCAAAPLLACVRARRRFPATAISRRARTRATSCRTVLQKVGVAQHLNQQLPLDAQFVDDTGKTVTLGDYFGKHPAILSLVYYNCPMLCSEEMDGLDRRAGDGAADSGQGLRHRRDQHRSERDAGAGGEEEGVLREALWAAGDGGRLALSDRADSRRSMR